MVDARAMDELKKLPPKERLKRLEELKKEEEVERKKQETEARKIINQSLDEIKLDEMLQEIEVPAEEIDVNKMLDQAKDIEAQVEAEKIKLGKAGGDDYGKRIQELLPQNTLNEIQNWYQQDNIAPSQEKFLEVYDNARQAYETVQASMQQAPDQQLYSSPSEELVENVVSSMKLLRSLGYKNKWFDGGP